MSDVSKHRKGWTVPEGLIAAGCIILGSCVVGLGFTGIYITVVPLLETWWHWFSPLYLAVSEGSFAFAYLGWLLLTMRDDPPRRLVAGLLAYLAMFAAASLALCSYASASSFPDLVSHVALCVAFFGAGIFAKVLVHRLTVDPSARAQEVALRDARQYAMDLLRARLGPAWRYRCPSLLRRQVTTGRLCDAVRDDIREKVAAGRSGGWESVIRDWVLGPEGLNLAAQAEEDARRVRESITGPIPVIAPEPLPVVSPAPPGSTPAKTSPRTVTASAVKRANRLGRKATDDDLLDAMREMAAEGRIPTKTRVKDELPVGDERAARLVAAYQREQPVPITRAAAAR